MTHTKNKPSQPVSRIVYAFYKRYILGDASETYSEADDLVLRGTALLGDGSNDYRRYPAQVTRAKRLARRSLSRQAGFSIGPAPVCRRLPLRLAGVAALFLLLCGAVAWFAIMRPATMRTLAVAANDTTLVLPDGSQVTLQKGSRLMMASNFGRRSRKVALSGQAFFDVATDSAHLFIVDAGQTSTTVHGTSFNILAREGSPTAEVTVNSGCVEVADKSGRRLGQFTKGMQLTYNAATGREQVTLVDVSTINGWRTGRFVLTNATVDDFRRQMERFFHCTVLVQPGAIAPDARINLSITTVRPTPDNVAQELCLIFGATYRKQGNRIVIMPVNNI